MDPSSGDEVMEISNSLISTTKSEIEQSRDAALKESLHNGVDQIEACNNFLN